MLREKLKNYHLVLASSSPRRQQFLNDLGLDFEIRLKPVEETYPAGLKPSEIAEYLAKLKADVFFNLKPSEIVITGDTIVCFEEKVLGKPKNEQEAFEMLRMLSGKKHEVISSICLKTVEKVQLKHAVTKVWFKKFSTEEIQYYIDNFKPFDKAGAYGIQEWIGKIGVEKIEGSYFNVMGMPVHLLYEMLKNLD